jgi:hypothetical protein
MTKELTTIDTAHLDDMADRLAFELNVSAHTYQLPTGEWCFLIEYHGKTKVKVEADLCNTETSAKVALIQELYHIQKLRRRARH